MNSLVLWKGPSRIDGKPIMLVATDNSKNTKTGAGLVQTWILRSDIAPLDAIHSGQDSSICGDCTLRGAVKDGRNFGRNCYVLVHNAPRSIYAAYTRGRYNHVSLSEGRDLLAGRLVRLGAYGDPAAVPVNVWRSLLAKASGYTGYTHQWRRFSAIRQFCMASVESEGQAKRAHLRGFRTFRIGRNKVKGESVCPASKEAGHKLTCDACLACNGSSGRVGSIVIAPHGIGAKRLAA